MISAFTLQLVATFNEAYGNLHFMALVLFFISIGLASIVYSAENRSYLGYLAFSIGLSVWVLYWTKTYVSGAAVPETISTLIALSWIIPTALKTYRNN